MNQIDRRIFLKTGLAGVAASGLSRPSPVAAVPDRDDEIVNGAEHAWLINDKSFPINPKLSNCPNSKPRRNYSMEHLLAEMQVHGIARTVISHVCYYGTDNSYSSHCVKSHPDRFAAIGLLVGHGLHRPGDP